MARTKLSLSFTAGGLLYHESIVVAESFIHLHAPPSKSPPGRSKSTSTTASSTTIPSSAPGFKKIRPVRLKWEKPESYLCVLLGDGQFEIYL